ncbi:MAG: metallophosphoesterase [Candidatus Zophobacter franzmannii]|nr:metallophosphoesterase [Candidatus Zophobacter franzmannii]
MINCLFISDFHGAKDKYTFLFEQILKLKPQAVFLGGDLLPHFAGFDEVFNLEREDFLNDFFAIELRRIREILKDEYPTIFLILGNDDPRSLEPAFNKLTDEGLIVYAHGQNTDFMGYNIIGYSFVPPTPFMSMDWEKFDVSRFVDVGCTPPTDGMRSVDVSDYEAGYSTIKDDLQILLDGVETEKSVLLMHTPPYKTKLDRAALDGMTVEHVPLDVHIGSIAVQRLLESTKFHLTLHGHIHESTRITGSWSDVIGETPAFQGATEFGEVSLIRFDLDNPDDAEVIKP